MTHETVGARLRRISPSMTGVSLLILATSALLPRFAGATRHAAPPALDPAQPPPRAEPDVASVPRTVPIGGCVVDRKGRPVAGARVYLSVDPDEPLTHTSIAPLVRATSGADGSFRFTVNRTELAARITRNGYPGVHLAAFAEGYGPAWAERLTSDDPDGNRLELVADDAPVAGRLIDLEGRPLPDVTVRRGPGRRHADRGPLAVAGGDPEGPEDGPPVLRQDVHEVAAGQPLDADSTG